MEDQHVQVIVHTDSRIVPPDKLKIVYLIFFMGGLGTLLPWNFYLTAIPYFEYQLGDRSVADEETKKTSTQILFANYLSLCSLIPSAMCNILSLLAMRYVSSFPRYVFGSILIFLGIIVTIILVRVELAARAFLGVTLAIVAIINGGAAFMTGGIFGIAALLPPRNMKACLEGAAVGGILAAVASLITTVSAPHPKNSALAYFVFACVLHALSAVMVLCLKKNSYFLYYWNLEREVKSARPKKSDSFGVEDSFDEDSVLDKTSSCFKLIQCMRETWLPGACVFLTLFITLSLYPSILTKIRPMHDEPPTAWTTKFFIPVIVFLSFNICDWIGRFVSGLLRWPGRNQMRLTLLFCCLRIVLVILCLFMNQKPRVLLPAVFIHDAFPIILVIVLGLTNGYLFALSMMHGPSFASPGHSESAGLALSLYLSVGLGAGVAVSYGLVLLL